MSGRYQMTRIAMTIWTIIVVAVTIPSLYSDDSPLIEKSDPRICEFSYSNFSIAARQERIPSCMALQVTDIFAQVFFVAGLCAGFTGLLERMIQEDGADSDQVYSRATSVFVGFSFVASFVLVVGRGIFSDIFSGDNFTHKMEKLGFEEGPFETVVWMNFTSIILIPLVVISVKAGSLGGFKLGQKLSKSGGELSSKDANPTFENPVSFFGL